MTHQQYSSHLEPARKVEGTVGHRHASPGSFTCADKQVLGLTSYPQEFPSYTLKPRAKATFNSFRTLVVIVREDQTHDLPLRKRTLYHRATRVRSSVRRHRCREPDGCRFWPARLKLLFPYTFPFPYMFPLPLREIRTSLRILRDPLHLYGDMGKCNGKCNV
jgi:hypothetical protein